jgi:hypothetical protein
VTQLRTRLGTAVGTSASTLSALSRWICCKSGMLVRSLRTAWNKAGGDDGVLRWMLRSRLRTGRPHRTRSLLRKYAALLVALVGGSLIINAAIEMYYSYGESREALIAVQREKAQGAAAVIEQFVKEIEGQVGWATGFLPAGSGLDQRRFDFLRLLRQAPAITEVSYLDSDGREQIKVSRLAMDTLASGADLSQEPKFAEARAKKRYFSPVYFRKESEPYLTLAIAGSGRTSGVTVAEVNLKFIWDVISRIHVGKAGAAYVVDERGLLIAHPDIGIVLRKTDLARLPEYQCPSDLKRSIGPRGSDGVCTHRHTGVVGVCRPAAERSAAAGLCCARAYRVCARRWPPVRCACRRLVGASYGHTDPRSGDGCGTHRWW